MKLTVDLDEMLSLVQNTSTINDAMLLISQAAAKGDVGKTLDAVNRAQELTMQAIKSSHAIFHQIRIRHGIKDKDEV